MNVNHFVDLNLDMQDKLLNYIDSNFSQQTNYNTKKSAYGLKQSFSRLYETKDSGHITSRCFMEAMIESGYKAKIINKNVPEDSKNWYFNVKILKD